MDSLVQNWGASIANVLDTAVLYFPQLMYELLLELLMVFYMKHLIYLLCSHWYQTPAASSDYDGKSSAVFPKGIT